MTDEQFDTLIAEAARERFEAGMAFRQANLKSVDEHLNIAKGIERALTLCGYDKETVRACVDDATWPLFMAAAKGV